VRIVNASPLILLARVDCLELLREPPDSELTVPVVVFQEVLAGEWFDPHVGTIRLAAGTWLRVAPAAPHAVGLDPDRLDAGELAVLSLAIENPGAIVVLDDGAARKEAIRRNIPLLGTAGILLRAKEQDRIATVRPVLDNVRQAGLYLTERLYRTVLRMAGE
jgi:predicted nucleic acid-binding protein